MINLEEKIINTFEYLHDNPEISWEEVRTTEYLTLLLEEAGCRIERFSDSTGVIAKWGNFSKNLPVVAIRADIDALWQEVNGEFRANHSCGHDAHMAIVLGVLWKIIRNPQLENKVALKFVFQPAEEKGAGALQMISSGILDDVDYLFGVHLRPKQETEMGRATPAIVHGATKKYQGKIIGHDAHGARPHQNANSIEIGAQIVNMLGQIHLDPRIPYSVKMTQFQAGGSSSNIIPGNATFTIDLRAQTNELMKELSAKVEEILSTVPSLFHGQIEISEPTGIVAAENNSEAIKIMEKSIVDVLGKDNLDPPLVTPGGDDFHYYSVKNSSLKATMLGLGCDLLPGLHHPYMNFNKGALHSGADILFTAILNTYQIKKY